MSNENNQTDTDQSFAEALAQSFQQDALEIGQLVTGTIMAVHGDIALVAAVATAHRREAFAVCAELVEQVKHRLPIWKRQVFDDGTDEWVNCP